MQVSHSRVECYDGCPFRYKLRYIDKIETLKPDNADNAFYLGTALHIGIEKDVRTAIKEYYNNFSIITDEQINEAIKLEYQIKKAKEILPAGEYEVPILDTDFIGFIDLLVPIDIDYDDNDKKIITYDLYDFKYSNNVYKYKDSPQLHLYKYYFEKTHPNKYINNMKFVLVPKVQIRQKKTEKLDELIGNENAEKVYKLMNDFMRFYRTNTDEHNIRMTIFMCPTSNPKTVIEKWGPDFKVDDSVYKNESGEYDYTYKDYIDGTCTGEDYLYECEE